MQTKVIAIHTKPSQHIQYEQVISVELNLSLDNIAGFRVVEVDSDETVINDEVPFQIDFDNTEDNHTLRILLLGKTQANTQRHYHLYLDEEAVATHAVTPWVYLAETYHQGQASYQVTTSKTTYIIHQESGGIASLIDNDGIDWIRYRPHGGSDGIYRGIPNIKHPDDYLHPGAENATTRILSQGPICCRIEVETHDKVVKAIWEIYPSHIELQIINAPDPYWLLYEGTPGGHLDEENGFIVRSDGTQTPIGETWDAVLDPGWLYFGDPECERVLFMAQVDTEPKLSSYFPMEGNMTVFGFGRKDLEHYLQATPARYLFGLLHDSGFKAIALQIESLRNPVTVEVDEQVTSHE